MTLRTLALLLLALQLAGCAGAKMKQSMNQEMPVLAADKSRIVFMRSSLHGIGVPAVMYEIVDEKPVFIGILGNKSKLYLDKSPGDYFFMSHGINVRFLEADMVAGKTYHVIVAPRGWPGINFSLYPVRAVGQGEFNIDTEQFRGISNETVLVEITPEAKSWAAERTDYVNARFEVEWPIWNSRPENFKASYTLLAQDGI